MKMYHGIVLNRIVLSEQEQSLSFVFMNLDEIEKKYLIKELKIAEHTLASAFDPDEWLRLKHNRNYL